METFKQKQVI